MGITHYKDKSLFITLFDLFITFRLFMRGIQQKTVFFPPNLKW